MNQLFTSNQLRHQVIINSILEVERYGENIDRIYTGIGINLVALACQYSLENGCEGHINLISKHETIDFYKSKELGGKQFKEGSQLIIFNEPVGQRLAKKYFPGGAIHWLN
uniref:hypothetical protein n=1 Tax=Niallia taxi TaxID=2499688 RepID=UPI003F494C5A